MKNIIDAEFTVVSQPRRNVSYDEFDAAFRKPIKPIRAWRMNWWPVIGSAVLGLPALIQALTGH